MERYAVIHSATDPLEYVYHPSSYPWIDDLKTALEIYHKEQPNDINDEISLIQMKELSIEKDNSISKEVVRLKYKGGYSDIELLRGID